MKVISVRKLKSPGDPPKPARQPIFELAAEFEGAAETLANSEMPPEVIADTLEGMRGEIEDRLAAICAVAKNLEAEENAIGAAMESMKKRMEAIASRREGLMGFVSLAMERSQIAEFSTPQFGVKLTPNPPSVNVTDFAALKAARPDLVVQPPQPPAPEPRADKAAIKDAIKNGEDVPGVTLSRTMRLIIK